MVSGSQGGPTADPGSRKIVQGSSIRVQQTKAQLEPTSPDDYYQLGEDEGLEGHGPEGHGPEGHGPEGHPPPRPTVVTGTVGLLQKLQPTRPPEVPYP